MSRPRLLDLFCGAGGAGMGYHRAGFDVVGVDIVEQPSYPFEFHRGDAMEYDLDGFDAIHASPPCQAYTWGTRSDREDRFPMLVDAIRERLVATGRPYVIENVPAAPLRSPVVLCGTMYGLPLIRHRAFESGVDLWPLPGHPRHIKRGVPRGHYVTVAGHGGDNARGNFRIEAWQRAMGIDWTRSREELAEAIPPAYTEWIGGFLRRSIEGD